jgi:NADPH-dependent 2,4-dienoyl-CoA reductase/sulfur reductase-like enzyme
LAKAAAKKGATKVEPAPVRVPAWLTVPKVAGVGAGPVGVVAALEAHAVTARVMSAAHAAQMVGCGAR